MAKLIINLIIILIKQRYSLFTSHLILSNKPKSFRIVFYLIFQFFLLIILLDEKVFNQKYLRFFGIFFNIILD